MTSSGLEPLHLARSTTPSRFDTALVLAVLCTSLTAAIISGTQSSLVTHKSLDGNKDLAQVSCGASIQEALANNCIFDETLNGWVPKECYNEQLAADAVQNDTTLAILGGSGPFPWYEDLDFTQPIPRGGLASYLQSDASNMTAYTWEKWHVAHCLYVWRLGLDINSRMARGETSFYVNVRVTDEGHVRHCNNIIANQDHRVGAKATVEFGFGTCVRTG